MEIKEYTFEPINSKMYIILEVDNTALVIDPCIHAEAFALLEHAGIRDVDVILTHEHYDHISGVNEFRRKFKCRVGCSEICAKNLKDVKRNLSKYYDILIHNKGAKSNTHVEPYRCSADWTFQGGKIWEWKQHEVMLVETPGHSEGSICILIDSKILFTGDSLLKNTPVITKMLGGNLGEYEKIAKPFLQKCKGCYVYPGHGENGWIEEFDI